MYMIFTIRQYDVLAENATPEEIDEMMKSYIVPLPVVIDEDLSLEEDEQMWNDEISSNLESGRLSVHKALSLLAETWNTEEIYRTITDPKVLNEIPLEHHMVKRSSHILGLQRVCETCVTFGEKELDHLNRIITGRLCKSCN